MRNLNGSEGKLLTIKLLQLLFMPELTALVSDNGFRFSQYRDFDSAPWVEIEFSLGGKLKKSSGLVTVQGRGQLSFRGKAHKEWDWQDSNACTLNITRDGEEKEVNCLLQYGRGGYAKDFSPIELDRILNSLMSHE